MASGFCSQPETHTVVFPVKGKICRLGLQVSCQRELVFTSCRVNAVATRSPGRTWKNADSPTVAGSCVPSAFS